MAAKTKKSGLGRGLGALLGEDAAPVVDVAAPASAPELPVTELPLRQIEPNRAQPRTTFEEEALEALAESIRQHGVLQPLAVRKLPSGFYQIIAGERRWRAARRAGLETLPVVVVEADDGHAMELALIENLQREDLNPIEEALGFRRLMDEFGLTQEDCAHRVGRSRPAVANALRLLQLPESVKAMVEDGRLSGGHARALLALPAGPVLENAAEQVVRRELSVRETEALVKSLNRPPRPTGDEQGGPLQVDYLGEVERRYGEKLGRKVHIVSGRRKGRFEIEFYGNDDLQALLDLLETLQK